MPRLREVEIAEIMDAEPVRCATCPTILEDHETTYCRTCGSYWSAVEDGLFDEDHPAQRGHEKEIDMALTPEELEKHKTLLARMGMVYTEPYGPTDMTEPKVQQRMREVDEAAHHVPSVFNEQNDFDLGNQVRMLTRRDSGHEAVVCAARDRIFGHSLRIADLTTVLKRLLVATDPYRDGRGTDAELEARRLAVIELEKVGARLPPDPTGPLEGNVDLTRVEVE